MKCPQPKFIVYSLFLIIHFKRCSAEARENSFTNFYYMKNQVLALREEIQITGVDEDTTFTGGYGIKHWLVLPSFSYTFLIGIRKQGLNLITINNKGGNLYQAVEKPIDIGENIISAVTFTFLNSINQRSENLVLVSTDSPKFEIMWYKIQNYKLVHIWSWIRYSGAESMLYASIKGEHRLVILDSRRTTIHVYGFSLESPTPSIRELEVISFEEKVSSISLSFTFSEPYLYVVHANELGIYRYSSLCSQSPIGYFDRKIALKNLNISHIYPFRSGEREYLAVAGKDSAVLRIDKAGNIVPEMNLANIMDWIIMRTGPGKEKVILFGKSISGYIEVFSNAGIEWFHHPAPSCFKYNKETHTRVEKQIELGCLKGKSWTGVATLEIGDLPTLIFADRKFFGEMFHVMLKMKQDILPLDIPPQLNDAENNYLMRMKSHIEGLVSHIKRNKATEGCNIFNMLTVIEKVALQAKEELLEKCEVSSNITEKLRSKDTKIHNKGHGGLNLDETNELEEPSFSNKFNEDRNANLVNENYEKFKLKNLKSKSTARSTTESSFDAPPISPDLEDKSSKFSMVQNDLDFGASGLPKKSEHII